MNTTGLKRAALTVCLAATIAACGGRTVPDQPGNAAQTALQTAIQSGDLAQVAAALDASPDAISKPDAHGQTPLHYAVLYKQPAVVKALLERGADPNAINGDGSTPLELAQETGSGEEIIGLLSSPSRT